MKKVRTLHELQEMLDWEMSWRAKEIRVFKDAADKYEAKERVYVRAGIAILYAHWEGFIKEASKIYLSHIQSKALRYRELKPCFVVLGMKAKINILVDSNKSRPNIEAMEFIMSKLDQTAKFSIESAFDTESNMRWHVFANIALSLAIDTSSYDTKFNLIDKNLVDRRNEIAHGQNERPVIDRYGFEELIDDIDNLMRRYKTDIENAASMEGYRAALTVAA